MAPHPHIDRPAVLVYLFEQKAMLTGLDDKSILPCQELLASSAASSRIDEWLGCFEE
jgi:hypothetical protein